MTINNTLAVFPSQLLGADNSYTSNDNAYYKKLNVAGRTYYSPIVKHISICDDTVITRELVTTTYKEKKEKL